MRLMRLLALTAIALCVFGASAFAADREVYIFKGGPLAQDGITAGAWGSGKASQSAEKVLTGSTSVKITTQGLYSGGRIDFSQPVPLYTGGIDPKRYVVFALYFEAVQTVDPGLYDIEPYTIPKAGKMRFVFVSDTGAKVAVDEPTNRLDPDDNWVRVAVPLSKFKAAGDSFNVKRLLVFTDTPTILYVGEIKLVTDDAPIKVDSLSAQTIAVYDEVVMEAVATGGVSSLKYSWDFDSSNGLQDELLGTLGRYTYTRGGDFTITLTVSDADDIKPPVTVSAKVEVID